MDVMPPFVSALTNTLIKNRLIERAYNQIDRRVVTIQLTETGMLHTKDLKNKQDR